MIVQYINKDLLPKKLPPYRYNGNQPQALRAQAVRDAKKFRHKRPFHMVKNSPWPFVTSQAVFVFILALVNFFHFWKTKKPIGFLTDSCDLSIAYTPSKATKELQPMLAVSHLYNCYHGLVDAHNAAVKDYSCDIRHYKWTLAYLCFCIKTTIVNSWILKAIMKRS